MERRKFVKNSVFLMAAASAAPVLFSQPFNPPKKGFKVTALTTRYKEKIIYADTPIDFKILSSDTEGRLAAFISTNNRKGFGPPLHIHYTFDEFFCVLEGSFLFELDTEVLSAAAGDCIFIPRNVKHRFNCISKTAGSLLVGITPATNMEAYFVGMVQILNKNDGPDMAALQELFQKYDSEVLGPPMK